MAWRVLRLRMEGSPPGAEGSCEYIEQAIADSRQGLVLHLVGWAWGRQPLTVKFIVTKYFKVPRTWTDSLVRPKSWLRIGSSGGLL
jgi:hypothetical protein